MLLCFSDMSHLEKRQISKKRPNTDPCIISEKKMFRNVNPVAGNHRWFLSPSWEVSYAYQSPGRTKRKTTKRLGAICEIATTKRGRLGHRTNVDLIAVRLAREPPRVPRTFFSLAYWRLMTPSTRASGLALLLIGRLQPCSQVSLSLIPLLL